jgi:hypothetical protein
LHYGAAVTEIESLLHRANETLQAELRTVLEREDALLRHMAHMWAGLDHPNDTFDTSEDADIERLRKIEVAAIAFAQRS